MSDFTLSSTMDAFLTEADSLVTPHGIKDINDVLSIDNNTRVLYDYMGNVVMEWAGANLPVYYPFGVVMNDATGVNFANGSRVKEGITDAGEGGAKGVAMVCSLDYEFKWEAGRLYVMGQDGFTIRVEQFGFTDIPDTSDDDTKGYMVGSRRILDDGTIYICADATTGAAIWNMDEASLTFLNHELVDSSNSISLDWETRQLVDSTGAVVMDWEEVANQPSFPYGLAVGASSIEMGGGAAMKDGALTYSNNNVLTWSNGYLIFPSGVSDAYTLLSIDTNSRELVNEAGTSIASWSNSYGLTGLSLGDGQRYIGTDSTLRFYDGTAHVDMVDWSYGLLRKSAGGGVAATTLDWYLCTLIGTDGSTVALDWSAGTGIQVNAIIRDSANLDSISPTSRLLFGSDGSAIAMDWSTGTPAFAQGASYTPTAYASLPASPVEGTVCYVNDADSPVSLGAVVADGGTEKVLACFNGTDWKVVAHL